MKKKKKKRKTLYPKAKTLIILIRENKYTGISQNTQTNNNKNT